MKHYILKFVEGGKAVFKISVVKNGAVDADIVKFNEETQTETVVFNNEEKQIFYSVVMRPNKKIFRKNINGEPGTVEYSKETVEQANTNYWRQKGNVETNINHSEETNAQGIFPIESWIVNDPETDKSKSLGLETFAGDWVAGYKVDNKELWDDYIKTGKLDGLSIEATHHKYELIPEIKMKKDEVKKPTFIEKVVNFFVENEKELEKFAEHEDEEKTEEEIEAAAEEKAEDAVEGKVEAAEEDAETKTEDAEVKTEETTEDETPTEKEQILLDKIVELEKEIADLKAKNVEAETSLETMKKETPAAKAITNLPPAPVKKSYEEMTNFEKVKFNRENK